ncbi:hypothetical protein V2G26_007701 [Clonostachys chloroleuca]
MDSSTTPPRRVAKRSTYACSRCRRQKIKCSGLQPCDNCAQRRLTCTFDKRDNKVMVTQGYLADLQHKIARLESLEALVARHAPTQNENSEVTCRPLDGDVITARTSGDGPQSESSPRPSERGSEEPRRRPSIAHTHTTAEPPELTNPLTNTPSQYMAASNGTAFYLGTSSNWGFSRRVLNVAHEHVCQAALPTDALLFDGCAYDLGWDGSRSSQNMQGLVVPAVDHAIYLINAVKFHCDQLFHMFDEEEFMSNLHRFYSLPSEARSNESSLWYIHFLVILAFGKSLVQQKGAGTRPPGVHFFVRALQLLPDATALGREPVISTEILCCMAWYYQALDFRHAAHNFIGQAKSTAMNHGMHTDMPVNELGKQLVERCRKIWWTVYILDRQMTSLMGLPQSTRDEGVHCQLPSYSGASRRTAALGMHIRFARIIADVSRAVYGTNGSINKKFVISTKNVLESIAAVADDLQSSFPLHADVSYVGISRIAAHLHLQYYQCIVLATRPLLYCCLLKRFEAPLEADALMASAKVRNPLQMCVESAQQILNILESLREQGLLETFIPLDLDSLSVSTIVILMARAVDIRLLENHPPWVDKANAILEDIVGSGNRIAMYRKAEMQKLDELLGDFIDTQHAAQFGTHPSMILPQPLGRTTVPDPLAPGLSFAPLDDASMYGEDSKDKTQPDEWNSQQIMAVASSMESDDADWLSFVMGFGTG